MSEEMFKLIVAISDSGGSHCWNCAGCDCAYKKLNKRILNLEKRQDDFDTKLAEHSGKHDGQAEQNKKFQEAIDEIKKDNKKEETIESASSSVFLEISDREQRKNNLILHQLPEPSDSVKEGTNRKKHDDEKLLDLLSELNVKINPKEDVKFCVRLGETRNDLETKPRPILIGFRNLDVRDNILQVSRNLSKTKYKDVSIIPDLTKRQRQQETDMRKEVDKRNSDLSEEDALNWIWKMVGMRGQRKIIKTKIQKDSEKRKRSEQDSDSGRPARQQRRK